MNIRRTKSHPRSPVAQESPASPATPSTLDALFAPTGLAASMPLAVLAWDRETRILHWNPAAAQMLGWQTDEARGMPIKDILPACSPDRTLEVAQAIFEEQAPFTCVTDTLTQDGRRLLCEWHCTLLKDAAGQPLAGISMGRDVTRERQAERERERLHEIASAANAAGDLDTILLMIRNAVIEVSGFDRAGVWLYEDGHLRGAWGTDTDGQLRDEHGLYAPCVGVAPELDRLLCGEQPYVIARSQLMDVPELGDRFHAEHPLFAGVALRARDEPIGLIFLDNCLSGRPILPAQVEALLSFCDQTAVAIANVRLLAERQRIVERQRRLMQIAAAINSSLELDEILRYVRDAVVEEGHFDRAGVFLVDGKLVRGAWGTDLQGKARPEHDYVDSFANWGDYAEDMAAGRLPFVMGEVPIADTEDAPREPRAVVALRTGGELVGLLCVDNTISRRPMRAENIEPLLAFAEQAAVAIRNARLLAERERHLERQRRLSSLAAAICASTALSDILRMVRDAIVHAGGFDRAAVYLYDRENMILRGTWGTDRDGKPADISARVHHITPDSQMPMQRMARGELDFFVSTDFTGEYDISPENTMYGVQAHALVPLRVEGVVVGVVAVDNLLRGARITEEDIAGLLPFADQAAVAIQNAQLFENLRLTQEALVRADKLRAVGELASGVAHNVNNVLAAVLGYAELIQTEESATAEIRHYARTIERAAIDGAEIVRRMQHFARKDAEAGNGLLDLSLLAREAIELTRPFWHNQAAGRGAKIDVQMGLTPDLWTIGSGSELREVLVNILHNAVDAMPDGGTLTVRSFAEEGQAVVEIADTGHGMEEATLQRVFEPFFTTKRAGMGTGLGLSVAWGIVDRHQGRIEVQSAPGQGSLFRVCLPPANRVTPVASAGEGRSTLTGARLLLVEDEEFVLGGLARILTARGAIVALAVDAADALDWLRDNAAECHMVISDHGMVGLTGLELL
ncbi:MAG TPA: GAF domain-containing protein, partial [Chthonomonadaceae bacterium]|nr:GAF domain-containing protein [Chthonomonadaceae bacterium]